MYYILDHDAVKSQKSGYNQPIAIPCEEVRVPDGPPVLPLKAAADEALALFREPKPEDLAVFEVPFSELPSDAKASTRHGYITLDRLIKYGPSPSCTGCEKVTGRRTHTHQRVGLDLMHLSRPIRPMHPRPPLRLYRPL